MSVTTVQRDLTTERYALNIGGRIYGPYTAQQMKAYVAEGRVTASSLVSREAGTWISASDDPFCAEWLAAAAPAPQPEPAPAPVKPLRTGGPADPKPGSASARDAFLKELEGVRLRTPAFANAPEARETRAVPAAPMRNAQADAAPVIDDANIVPNAIQSANMVLVFDLKSRGHGKLEEDIMSLGPASKIMAGVWVLHTELSSGAVRNQLMKHFGAVDSIFIVDASRDKTTWFNLGPEVDSHIRKVWRRS